MMDKDREEIVVELAEHVTEQEKKELKKAFERLDDFLAQLDKKEKKQ